MFVLVGVVDSCVREVFGLPRLLMLPPTSTWLVMIATAVLSPNSFCAQVLEEGNEEGEAVGEINICVKVLSPDNKI